jgi:nicotinamidase-related amidase
MKEAYYTLENIPDRAGEFILDVEAVRRDGRQVFQPEISALLVLDMQKYFLDPASHAFVPSALAILPGLERLARVYHARNRPVICTRHLNTPQNAGSMGRWWRELICLENPLSEIAPGLLPFAHTVLPKTQYDAFYQTGLEEMLHLQGVQQVVVSGVMTHLCCETTARSAFVRGFEVIFLVDGTAAYTAAHHRAAILNLAHGFAAPLRIADILSQLPVNEPAGEPG